MKKFNLSQVKSMVLDVETLGMILAYLESIVRVEHDMRKTKQIDFKSSTSIGAALFVAFTEDIGENMIDALKETEGYKVARGLLSSENVATLIFDDIGLSDTTI